MNDSQSKMIDGCNDECLLIGYRAGGERETWSGDGYNTFVQSTDIRRLTDCNNPMHFIHSIKASDISKWLALVIVLCLLVGCSGSSTKIVPVSTYRSFPSTRIGGGSGLIAFSSDRDGYFQIYLMNTDGSDQRNISNSSSTEESPNWSPDGKHIAFSLWDNERSQIYVMNIDGTNRRNLSNSTTSDMNPMWSPDGKHIAYVAYVGKSGNSATQVHIMDANGHNQRRLSTMYDANFPTWSSDSKQIAFIGQLDRSSDIFQLYVIDVDGSKQHVLFDIAGGISAPSWSSDGKFFAFETSNNGNIQIFVTNFDGNNPHNLSKSSSGDRHPVWSPDGKYVAFESGYESRFYRQLYVMDVSTSYRIRLTDGRSNNLEMSWQP